MMNAHSTIIGGSTALRLLSCPASYRMLKRVPDKVETTSIFAAQHTVVAECIADELDPQEFVGRVVNGVTLTHEHIAAVRTVLDHVDVILTAEVEFLIEEQVRFPGVNGAFGTIDFAARKANKIKLLDWKFGAGVQVSILYGELINPQPLFYACALRHSFPGFCSGVEEYELGIVQPAFSDDADCVIVTNDDLDTFERLVLVSVAEARSETPRRQRGPWCRFAACKTICPEWTAPLLDAATFAQIDRKAPDYGDALAAAMAIAGIAEEWAREVRSQTQAYLEKGGDVSGWKLVDKRATRRWQDEAAAMDAFSAANFALHDLVALKSPAQVEKIAKAQRRALPADAVITSVSTGTTLAPADDPRARKPGLGAVIESFRQAIAELGGPTDDA
jgi:hypothetical protein